MISWYVTPLEKDRTLLEAMSIRLPAAPVAFLRQTCKKQRVLLNGQTAEASRQVAPGDRVEVKLSARLKELLALNGLAPEMVLYEDPDCIVLDKPAGLIVHPAPGHSDSLLSRLEEFYRLRGERFRVAPIHRLDRCTSGPVMFGKGRKACRHLGTFFMDGRVRKQYLALTEGTPPESGKLSSPVPAHGKEKSSLTHYRKIAQGAPLSLLDLTLGTGRKHQIRRQLADAGWPLAGDARYGRSSKEPRLPLLHCHRLEFPAGDSTERVTVRSALRSEQVALLADFGLPTDDDIFFTEKTAPFTLGRV